MKAVHAACFLNPDRGPQIYENEADPADRYFNYGDNELPGGAYAKLTKDGTRICAHPSLAPQAPVIFARFVWGREAPDHMNLEAPEAGNGRFYRFVARISFPSVGHDGYRASILARLTARPSGARRRADDQPKPYACLGDASELITVRIVSAEKPPRPRPVAS